jgi:hypothetical protein
MSIFKRRVVRMVLVPVLGALGVPALVAAAASTTAAQVELDRILSRAGGRIVTQSDVRQARALGLVDDTSSDEAVRRALEDRWLILNEIGRAAPLVPVSEAELAARRGEWEAGGGAGRASVPMIGEADLETWLRDDLRIRAFLLRQFGGLPEGERARAQQEWMARLRARAELD